MHWFAIGRRLTLNVINGVRKPSLETEAFGSGPQLKFDISKLACVRPATYYSLMFRRFREMTYQILGARGFAKLSVCGSVIHALAWVIEFRRANQLGRLCAVAQRL